jgi:hypothetical protein
LGVFTISPKRGKNIANKWKYKKWYLEIGTNKNSAFKTSHNPSGTS